MIRKIKTPLWVKRIGIYLAVLGPGLITASADNDAPGIATYSMAGSTYGYRFLSIILIVTLGEIVVQEMAARMGVVTGKGTADLIRERFGVKVTTFAMFSLLIANLGTTVAQIAGIAASAELFGVSRYIAAPLAAILVSFSVLKGSYKVIDFSLIEKMPTVKGVLTYSEGKTQYFTYNLHNATEDGSFKIILFRFGFPRQLPDPED